ncbi:ATP-binding protein [Daejeonella sp. H1SJ63]|uniref:sensor histidine kinase n=1 Tax=Daejeonella sp. H1SJ63 TaxID=3034145 RepID=UPI0023EBA670|nr:ATP-binding protein [Daejeonella sp. H1SJ63]
MSVSFKIRVLLLILTAGFALTALTINYTNKNEEILALDAQKLEIKIRGKEELIGNLLNSPAFRDSLKNVHNNDDWAQYIISEFSEKRNISFQTFENGKLKFWTGHRIALETDTLLKEGSTFLQRENGYYEAIRRVWGNFSVVCFIPVKSQYPYQNEFLKNRISPDLLSSNSLDIAGFNDKDVYTIRNLNGKYLFSVKLNTTYGQSFYTWPELIMWVFSIICGLVFLTSLSSEIAAKGYARSAIFLLLISVLACRLVDLEYRYFSNNFDLAIFSPKHYASSYYFPSIGDLFLNIIAFTWVLSFAHAWRNHIIKANPLRRKYISYLIFIVAGLIVCASIYATNELFFGLISNSNIYFRASNILSSSWLSWFSVLLFCFSIFNLFLIISTVLGITSMLNLSDKERLNLFLAGLFLALIYRIFFSDFTIFFLLIALLLFLAGSSYYKTGDKINPVVFVIALLIFATIGSLKLSRFQNLKERESRKLIAAKLESSADPNAVVLFYQLEKDILKDKAIIDYFSNPISSHNALNYRLGKLYMAGYLSRYDFESLEYNENDEFIKGDKLVPLSAFKNRVLKGSVKVSEYFYQINNTFGYQQYFALLPVRNESNKLGTMVIELKSKRLDEVGAFPELLVDGKIKDDFQLNDYSYAYYNNDKLIDQHGTYVYNLRNNEFKGKNRHFVYINNAENGREYNHLIYQANPNKLIIISREGNSILNQLASVSFIFLALLFFTGLLYLLHLIYNSFHQFNFSFRNFRWTYLILSNKMLYKTRIQVSMVFAVVFTLLITGIITFYNISSQYREQQEAIVLDKVTKISAGINRQLVNEGIIKPDDQAEAAFNTFADLNGVDLNLFDLNGRLVLSTQPKIYENGLIAPVMNSWSYLYLNRFQKSEYINNERIGDLSFIVAYVPLRNSANEEIAYLGLPYFSNEKDYQDRIGTFLNALINVYALVFVAIGFFAVFVAKKITSPLTLVEESLRKTQIGRKNEPILWKSNDEIGKLIKEYNNMIAALEESALKLGRSERETAWREMAKQVAHEIKNPLTPLKLGVQLLEKSWKEKDPKFDVKFEKFSKSFIEQIESLAHIASEFSNFAKMPETILEPVVVRKIIDQSVELYRQSENTVIRIDDQCKQKVRIKADRDQLLRCFNNLIKNAIEARQEGKQCLIDIRVYCEKNRIYIEVRDNGKGIPNSVRDKIFVPNFTTKSSGTGLGLAFVKQAIENIDGSIRFETAPGLGTTFYIMIPIMIENL